MNEHVRHYPKYNELITDDLKPYGISRTSFRPRRIAEKVLDVLARLPLSRPFGLSIVGNLTKKVIAQGADEHKGEFGVKLPGSAGVDISFVELDVMAIDDHSAHTGQPILTTICDAASGVFIAYTIGLTLSSPEAIIVALQDQVFPRPYTGAPVHLDLDLGGAA
ncbi:MAG: hypothetical protein WDN02_02770 [Methylovirgula sp.]|uniref:hypothetical protein n=1 Tax=Methylovirgula sp. TaxID=1978224 RepID=UPI0030765FCB